MSQLKKKTLSNFQKEVSSVTQNIDIEEDTVSKKKDNIKDINNGRE